MANTVTNRCKAEIVRGTIDWLNNADIKWMLADDVTAYTISKDTDFVDDGGSNDLADAEYAGTGYTGGFNGSGRKALASKTLTEDDGNDRAELDAADPVYSAIGSGSESINQIAIIDETSQSADNAVDVLAIFDSNLPVTTNGGDVTFSPDAQGILQFT